MNNLLKNWNYKKHALTVSSFYLGIATLGNLLFLKRNTEQKKLICSKKACKDQHKKKLVFNGVIAAMYGVDMTVAYLCIKKLQKHSR